MKLQISFELSSLSEALEIAEKTAKYADILEIGSLLLYREGIKAIEAFKEAFPGKDLAVDSRICDRAEESVSLFAQAGANIISVLAGTNENVIYNASKAGDRFKAKIALDLIDAYSMEQAANDAKNLGVDVIYFHRAREAGQATSILEEWENTAGNTDLPIFISGKINESNIDRILVLRPHGLIVGDGIIKADDPAEAAADLRARLDAV